MKSNAICRELQNAEYYIMQNAEYNLMENISVLHNAGLFQNAEYFIIQSNAK